MVGGVRDDEVVGAGEGGEDAQVGLVAGREDQGGGAAEESGEGRFQERGAGGRSPETSREAPAPAPYVEGGCGGPEDGGVSGEPQVVVAGEVDEGSACEGDLGPGGAGEGRTGAVAVASGQLVELGAEQGAQRVRWRGVFHVKQVGAV